MNFPQYRKLMNDKSFYRIDSERSFCEIQLIGSKCFLHQTEAKKYPEIIRIQDMLNFSAFFVHCSSDEFNTYYSKVLEK